MNLNALLEAISLILIDCDISQKQLIKQLRYVLAHTANNKNPNATENELSNKTGLTRKVIRGLLSQEPPKIPVSKESMILRELWNNRDCNNTVKVKGIKSFYSIAAAFPCDYSPTTCLNNLIQSECIEHYDENSLLIKSDKLIVDDNKDESIRILCKSIHRLTKTVLHNMSHNDKKYQNTIKSNLIKPKDLGKVHIAVFDYLKNTAMKELKEIIDSYESEDSNNYPEYTVSLFEHF